MSTSTPGGILYRFHNGERGTALTEFAITLPIYLVFVFGIINIYNMQRRGLESEQEAAANLWEEATGIQHSYKPAHMVPLAGMASVYSYYSHINEGFGGVGSGDMLDFGSMIGPAVDYVSAGGGMYVDSGGKAGLFEAIGLANTNDFEPKMLLSNLMDDSSFSHTLMNDLVAMPSGGWGSFSGVVGNLLTMSGTRPALAAGIRYGVAGGTSNFEVRNYAGDSTTVPLGYVASAPTMPEERLAAVLFSYMEVSSDDSFQNMIHFGLSNIGSAADGIDQPDIEGAIEEATECQEAAQEFGVCAGEAAEGYSWYPGCCGGLRCNRECWIERQCDHILPDHCDMNAGAGEMDDIKDCLDNQSWGNVGAPGDPTSDC